VLRLIGENQADLGICAWGPGRYQVETFPYHQDQLVLLAPHQHPLAERRALFFHETLEYDFVEIRRGSALSNLMLGAASRANMPLKFRLQVGSFDAVVAMVRAGLALGVAPEAILRNDQRGYRVIRLKDDWATRRLSVVVRDWNALPEAARQVAKRLIQSR
jgi:DNA-binding transcriptional LysR family regulator